MHSPWTEWLFMHGHITRIETARTLLQAEAEVLPQAGPRPRRRRYWWLRPLPGPDHVVLDLIPAPIRSSIDKPC